MEPEIKSFVIFDFWKDKCNNPTVCMSGYIFTVYGFMVHTFFDILLVE